MKNSQPSVKKNFIMNVILTLSSFIFPLITFPYITRILLPDGTGKIQFVTSVVAYFNMFAQLGIPTYGIKAIAQVRDNKKELTKVAQELLIINIVMSLVTSIVLYFSVLQIPRLYEEKTLYIIIGSTIALSAIGMEWVYKGLEKYTYITVRSLIFKFIATIAMFALVRSKSDYIIYGTLTVFASVGSNIMNFINIRKYISLKPAGDYNFKRHFKAISTFFAMACAAQIYTQLDTIMLGFIINDYEVGIYNAAVKIKNVLLSIVTSLGAVLLPRASYYVEHNEIDEFKRITNKGMNFVILISIPMCIYFILYAKQGIQLLSGNEFLDSVLPMQLIMPTLVLIGITNILGIQVLVPLGRETTVLYSEITGAVADVIINYALIPKHGSIGAAIGTLAAEFVVFIFQFCVIKKIFPQFFTNNSLLKTIIASLFATVLCVLININIANVFLTLVISSFVFFGTYFLMLCILKENFVLHYLRIFLKKVKNNSIN